MSALIAIIIIAGAIAFALYGYSAGIINQLGSIAAFVVGFVAARVFGPVFNSLFSNADEFLCAAIVFVVFFTVTMIVVKMLRITVRMMLLGPVDRILGAPVGVLKWLLLTSVVLNLFLLKNPDTKALDASPSQWTLRFLPKVVGVTQSYIDRAKHVTEQSE